jgi:phosphatidylserine decarboxylase
MTIHREGTNILILLFVVLALLNVPVWLFLPPVILPAILTGISVLVYSFVFNFFRSPRRYYKGERKEMVVSSVDGRIVALERVFEPEYLHSEAIQLSVFMSPLNVHANWFPVDGKVEMVRHHRGRFLSAYLPKSSILNERSTIGILCPNGQRITVRQVAGAMARRIVTYAGRGAEASIDEHLGFIKFGSRVDIYLPVDAEILVKLQDRTRGGLTPIARLQPADKAIITPHPADENPDIYDEESNRRRRRFYHRKPRRRRQNNDKENTKQ